MEEPFKATSSTQAALLFLLSDLCSESDKPMCILALPSYTWPRLRPVQIFRPPYRLNTRINKGFRVVCRHAWATAADVTGIAGRISAQSTPTLRRRPTPVAVVVAIQVRVFRAPSVHHWSIWINVRATPVSPLIIIRAGARW